MKKCITTIITMICLIMLMFCFTSETKALGLDDLGNPNSYISGSNDSSDAIEIANIIVWIVRTVGQAIAVIMLLIVGLKYIIGSAEEKAEYKKNMWPIIIGAILIFAGATFTDFIYGIFQS